MQTYLVVSFVPVVAMNSGGPANLAANVVFLAGAPGDPDLAGAARTRRVGRPFDRGVQSSRDSSGSASTSHSCTVSPTSSSNPRGYPRYGCSSSPWSSMRLAIAGLWMHRRREPLTLVRAQLVEVEPRELRLVLTLFGLVLGLGFVLSWFRDRPDLFMPILSELRDLDRAGLRAVRDRLPGTGVREFRDRS